MSAEPITTGPRHRVDAAPQHETLPYQPPVIEGEFTGGDTTAPAHRSDQQSPPQQPPSQQPPSSTPPAPAPAGRRKKWPLALAIVVVVLGALVGGGAFATNAYAKGRVCDDVDAAVASATAQAAAPTSAPTLPNPAEMRTQVEDTRLAARMLMFDGTLKTAVTALALGAERVATLIESMATATPEQQGAIMPQLGAANGELNTLLGQAQVACG